MKKYIITLLFCTLFCHLGIAQGLKSVSILGDSYSTFEGYVQPDTNFVWYLKTPPKGRKTDMVSVRNESVRTICKHYQIDCIELKGLDKMSGHPSVKGMKQISEQVKAYMAAHGK